VSGRGNRTRNVTSTGKQRPQDHQLYDFGTSAEHTFTYFYGIPKRTTYIKLPDEDASYTESGEKECGLFTKSMYGTQDASNIWQSHPTSLLESANIKRGRSNASVLS